MFNKIRKQPPLKLKSAVCIPNTASVSHVSNTLPRASYRTEHAVISCACEYSPDNQNFDFQAPTHAAFSLPD